MSKTTNYVVISDHFNDLTWLKPYLTEGQYTIYDKKEKNVGYNLSDYFSFILDNYSNLPEVTIFMKGNLYPRHVTIPYWESVMNNKFFTPLEDWRLIRIKGFDAMWSGGYFERNNNWMAYKWKEHPAKYFNTYNALMEYLYESPPYGTFIRFAPGANYIVPKENILKIPKIVYEQLRTFVSHHQLSAESHVVEKTLHTLWTSPLPLKKIDAESLRTWNWHPQKLDLKTHNPI